VQTDLCDDDDDELDQEETAKRYELFLKSGCSNCGTRNSEDDTVSSMCCRSTRDEAKVIVEHYEDTSRMFRGKEDLAAAKSNFEHFEIWLAKILEVETAQSSTICSPPRHRSHLRRKL
jgi:hypothetical protein